MLCDKSRRAHTIQPPHPSGIDSGANHQT